MFGSKILSLVSFLFIGSQFMMGTKAEGDCTISLTLPSTLTVGESCAKGYYIVSGDNEGSGTYSLGTSGAFKKYIKVTGTSDGEVVIPDENGCSGKVGELAEVNEGEEGRKKRGKVVKLCLDENDETSVGFEDAGSYLVDTSSIFVNAEKSIAKVETNVIKAIAIESGKNYLVTDKAELVTSSNGKTVIINGSNQELNTELMEWTYNYCVDDNMVVWKRKEDLCNSSKAGDCVYYNCDEGDCTVNKENILVTEEKRNGECNIATSPENCEDGSFYLVLTSNKDAKTPIISETGGVGPWSLIKCAKPDPSGQVACNVLSDSNVPTSYLVNAGKGTGDAAYIQCTVAHVCSPIASITDDRLTEITSVGQHMITINSNDLLGITSEASKFVIVKKDSNNNYLIEESGDGYYTTTTGQSIVQNSAAGDLYSCTDKTGYTECENKTSSKPIGYLVNGGVGSSGKPYIKCTVSGSCQAYALVASCTGNDSSNYGDLYDNEGAITLCKVKNDETELILDGTGEVTGEFFASVGTTSLFGTVTKIGYNIVLKFEDGNIVVDNDAIRYRYTLEGEAKIHSRSVAHNENSGGEICETGKNGSNAYEYLLANWDNAKQGLSENVAYYVNEDYEKA